MYLALRFLYIKNANPPTCYIRLHLNKICLEKKSNFNRKMSSYATMALLGTNSAVRSTTYIGDGHDSHLEQGGIAQTQSDSNQHRKGIFTRLGIIDKTEPILITGILTAVAGICYSFATDKTEYLIANSLMGVTSLVAEFRVRYLGTAKKLSDSVDELKLEITDLQKENGKLSQQVDLMKGEVKDFEEENDKFKRSLNLLGGEVDDIEDATEKLFALYEKVNAENKRAESNNLLSLFLLVDQNKDNSLDESEMHKLRKFIKIVYNKDYNFELLDRDHDGRVDIKEFFEKFRDREL